MPNGHHNAPSAVRRAFTIPTTMPHGTLQQIPGGLIFVSAGTDETCEASRSLGFYTALSLGPTTHAATLFSQEELEPKGDEQVTVDEQPAVAEGAKVTIRFTLMVPETRQSIPNNVSEYTPGENEINSCSRRRVNGDEARGAQAGRITARGGFWTV